MDEIAGDPVKTKYDSVTPDIPSTFLKETPEQPVTFTPIDFASSPVPEYDGYKAYVIENVLSPTECQQLIAYAEASVPKEKPEDPSWKPALVNIGGGYEAAIPNYRNSDRIIWDDQDIVDRIWDRCRLAEGLEALITQPPPEEVQLAGHWEFKAWNNRMRFLKYSPGQYFKPHCDGAYTYFENGTEVSTLNTVQLYLNDSQAASPENGEYTGGATSFLSRQGKRSRKDNGPEDKKRRLDVSPKAGSVLIFQHEGLYHEGAELVAGTKYVMRTDILYKWCRKD